MYIYLILEVISAIIGAIALLFVIYKLFSVRVFHKILKGKSTKIALALFLVAVFAGLLSNRTYSPNFAMPLFMHSHAPGGLAPSIPLMKITEFLAQSSKFSKVDDIGADPNIKQSTPQTPDSNGVVRINLVAQEVISEIAEGIFFNYWTYNNQVPGPFLRVKEGDMVEVSLTNHPTSLHPHNIDLHAVTGPGGGASLTNVAPGETKTFRWKALSPGLFVYHCATPNVSTHNSHGQYGMILVEPSIGFSKVDKEFYVMQGELYTKGQLGKQGLVVFDSQALLDGIPNYVTFNGRIETTPRMTAKVGDTVRMYVGNGGVNLISSFHVIGEIFDTVYPNASIGGAIEHNTQATAVLPGGAAIVEFKLDVPGKYLLVDHALARMNKGAWAVLEVTGEENPAIFAPVSGNHKSESH